jgi:hypothetical protein
MSVGLWFTVPCGQSTTLQLPVPHLMVQLNSCVALLYSYNLNASCPRSRLAALVTRVCRPCLAQVHHVVLKGGKAVGKASVVGMSY